MCASVDGQEAAKWQVVLAGLGHKIEAKTATEIHIWWSLRNATLLLEGEPGCGKTSLVEAMVRHTGAKFYRIQCYGSLNAQSLLYKWNQFAQELGSQRAFESGKSFEWYDRSYLIPGKLMQALLDPAPQVIVLFDELDKVPEGSECEACILQYTGEGQITINETNDLICRPPGLPPLAIAVTSNAGRKQLREALSAPLRRRSIYVEFAPLSAGKIEEVLASATPTLSPSLRTEIARFVDGLRRSNWKKPIALSETIIWAKALNLLGVTQLTEEVVQLTSSVLAKGHQELKSLQLDTPRLIRFAREHRLLEAA